MKRFRDKAAIVTGGGSGIGRALSELLGQNGARVTVADLDEKAARETADKIISRGGKAEAARLDVSRQEEVQALIEQVATREGGLDYMFNNAGITVIGECRDTAWEEWQRIIAVNQMGVIYGTLAAYNRMIAQGHGHIVNTASCSGLMSYPLVVPYATTKHAVVGLSISLRPEAAGLGVKVSVVCPGAVKTNIIKGPATKLKMKMRKIDDPFAELPMGATDPQKAAKIILRGVLKNRAIIIFPFHIQMKWWLSRVYPETIINSGRLGVSAFRKFLREA